MAHEFSVYPCMVFWQSRCKQANVWPDYRKVIAHIMATINGGDLMTARQRYRVAFRIMREEFRAVSTVLKNDLYAPAPPDPLPTYAEMQAPGYWGDEADRLAKLERLAVAAAKTYEFHGDSAQAEHYWRIAEEIHVAKWDAQGTAIDLRYADF